MSSEDIDVPCLALMGGHPSQPFTVFTAGDRDRYWENGTVIDVFFLNGESGIHDEILTISNEWSHYANITFRKSQSIHWSDIRVSCEGNQYWAKIGRYARYFHVSMCLGGALRSYCNKEIFRNKVLHAFGHILGLNHEASFKQINYNKEIVSAELTENKWKEKEINANVLNPRICLNHIRKIIIGNDDIDAESVMCPQVPKRWLSTPESMPINCELSVRDKELIAAIYPESARKLNKYERFVTDEDMKTLEFYFSYNPSTDELTMPVNKTKLNKDLYTRKYYIFFHKGVTKQLIIVMMLLNIIGNKAGILFVETGDKYHSDMRIKPVSFSKLDECDKKSWTMSHADAQKDQNADVTTRLTKYKIETISQLIVDFIRV